MKCKCGQKTQKKRGGGLYLRPYGGRGLYLRPYSRGRGFSLEKKQKSFVKKQNTKNRKTIRHI